MEVNLDIYYLDIYNITVHYFLIVNLGSFLQEIFITEYQQQRLSSIFPITSDILVYVLARFSVQQDCK